MRHTTIDIVVPVKNDRRIHRLVESLYEVKTKDKSAFSRLIVVVNGSPRSLKRALLRLAESFSDLLVLESPPGIAHARNAGIRAAQAKYILHLDSDCLLANGYFDTLRGFLEHTPLSVGRGTVIFVPRTGSFSRWNCYLRDKVYSHHDSAFMPNLLVRRSLYERYGFLQEETFAGEDTEWGERMAIKHGPRVLPMLNAVVFHEDDPRKRKTLKMWFRYGEGYAFRSQTTSQLKLVPLLSQQLAMARYFPNARLFFYLAYLAVYTSGFLYYKIRLFLRA